MYSVIIIINDIHPVPTSSFCHPRWNQSCTPVFRTPYREASGRIYLGLSENRIAENHRNSHGLSSLFYQMIIGIPAFPMSRTHPYIIDIAPTIHKPQADPQEFMEMMRGGRSMSLSMETTTPKSKADGHPRSPSLLRSRSKASKHSKVQK